MWSAAPVQYIVFFEGVFREPIGQIPVFAMWHCPCARKLPGNEVRPLWTDSVKPARAGAQRYRWEPR
jgi:hypothetical protein